MKKFLTMTAAVILCASVGLGETLKAKLVTIDAGDTNATATISLGGKFGEQIKVVDRLIAAIDSGTGTGTVAFATTEFGIDTTIVTSGNLASGTLYSNYPLRTFLTSEIVNVVTGDVVIAAVNVTSNQVPYATGTISISISQPAAADDTVYNIGVIVK